MRTFFVVGMGPGSPDYLIREAERTIEAADTLIGADRHLERYRDGGKRLVRFSEVLPRIREAIDEERAEHTVAILVSGDPGWYSLLGRISKLFAPSEYWIIPGVSTVQLAFARLGMCREDAIVVSVHGREIAAILPAIRPDRPALVLTDRKRTPGVVAKKALEAGMENRSAWVLERLSYSDERITKTSLEELPTQEFDSLCVLVLAPFSSS